MAHGLTTSGRKGAREADIEIPPRVQARRAASSGQANRVSNRLWGEPTPCVPLMRRKGTKVPVRPRDHLSVKGPFCGQAELARLGPERQHVSLPSDPPELGVANADTDPLRLGHALPSAVGSAPCDRVAVQHNPRTAMDIQSLPRKLRDPYACDVE
jgi:hypothetical protein